MADAVAFEWLCSAIEEGTSLNRLETRGTVRIALKEAGLDAHGVTADQLAVVVDRILPAELESRGVTHADELCAGLAQKLGSLDLGAAGGGESPEDVFKRLAGG